MATQTRQERRSANIARHEAANRQRADEAAIRKEERRSRHEHRVDAQRRGRAARLAQAQYERLLARDNVTDEDFDEVMAARDAASNDRAYINCR